MTKKLGYSEASAQKRIQIARCSARFPELLNAIVNFKLTLSIASLIAPHLTDENKARLIESVGGKTSDEARWIVAALANRPAVKDAVREVKPEKSLFTEPTKENEMPTAKLTKPDVMRPATVERASVQFSCSKDLVSKLKRCQELLKNSNANASFEQVFEEALDALLEKKDPLKRQERREKRQEQKLNQPKTTRDSNHMRKPIPRPIRDAVYKRYNSQCCFTSNGTRCTERGLLHIDHIRSVCHKGTNSPANLQLLCANHNALKAKLQIGKVHIEKIRAQFTPSPTKLNIST